MGTPEDPNAPRLATAEDWKRCPKHPIHPVERAPGQTKAANFAHNWTDGTRVVLIWAIPVLLAFWGLAVVVALGISVITQLLVINTARRPMIKIYDEEWFYAIRAEEARAGPWNLSEPTLGAWPVSSPLPRTRQVHPVGNPAVITTPSPPALGQMPCRTGVVSGHREAARSPVALV